MEMERITDPHLIEALRTYRRRFFMPSLPTTLKVQSIGLCILVTLYGTSRLFFSDDHTADFLTAHGVVPVVLQMNFFMLSSISHMLEACECEGKAQKALKKITEVLGCLVAASGTASLAQFLLSGISATISGNFGSLHEKYTFSHCPVSYFI